MTRTTLSLSIACTLVLLTGCELLGDAPTWDDGGSDVLNTDGETSDGDADAVGTCAPVEVLSCGSVVQGDTADFNTGATTEIDHYAGAVGNYEAQP